MAVNSTLTKTSLVLQYQNGVNDNGDPKFTTQKFSRLKFNVTDEGLKEVADKLAGLLFSDNVTIKKEEDYVIE